MKWDAELYDQKHAFVFEYGKSVLDLLNPKAGERILDIGCGTGYLTDQIRLKGATVLGTDYSSEMIKKAKSNYPETFFEVTDAEDLSFDLEFDVVFSNATLHWIKNHPLMLKNVYRSLKRGGRFVAEMGGNGNIEKLLIALRSTLQKYGYQEQAKMNIWYFPSVEEYSSLLQQAGFEVTFAAHFNRDTKLEDGDEGVKKWLAMFGQPFFAGVAKIHKEEILKEVTTLLKPVYQKEGNWYADYKRLRFAAVKQ